MKTLRDFFLTLAYLVKPKGTAMLVIDDEAEYVLVREALRQNL